MSTTAFIVFRHLVGALTAGPRTALIGANSAPSCEILNAVTERLNESTAVYAMVLLRTVLDQPSELTAHQFALAGSAARNLLTFLWAEKKRRRGLVTDALRSVCETFSSNPEESSSLLRKCIGPTHLKEFGYEEIHRIAPYLKEIAVSDPQLVSDIYAAVFDWDEQSEETTEMSRSNILALTSNRRQDYAHAKWQLAQDFGRFASLSAVYAAEAMARVMNAYGAKEHGSVSSEPTEDQFEVNGVTAKLVGDYSCVWDEGWASQDKDELKILGAFFSDLERRIQDPSQSNELDRIINALITTGRQAVIWRSILRTGAQYPADFGIKLRALSWAVPLLRSIDTKDDAARFVGAVFPLIKPEERQKVERAILSLSEIAPGPMHEAAVRNQAELLSGIREADLVTADAKSLANRLSAERPPKEPPTTPRVQLFQGTLDERTVLRETLGVSPDTEAHKLFLDLRRPVDVFQATHLNGTPSLAESEAALPDLEALDRALQDPDTSVDPKLLRVESGRLAAACAVIARAKQLSCTTPMGEFALKVLLRMSDHPDPEPDPESNRHFDKSPSWASSIARIEAAAGLISIAENHSCCTSEVLDAIDRLSRDAASQVRYQIATRLTCLCSTAPEKMWQLLDRGIREDTSMAVLREFASVLNSIAVNHEDRSSDLSKLILERAEQAPSGEEPRRISLHVLVGLYVWRAHTPSGEALTGMLAAKTTHRDKASLILFGLREALTYGDAENPNEEHDAVRTRAIGLFDRIVTLACDDFTGMLTQAEAGPVDDTLRTQIKQAAQLISAAAKELYFASGVFDGQQGQGTTITQPQQERFYRELAPTISRLAAVGLPSAVQDLVEMLSVFVPLDPRHIFLQIAALIENGKRWQYHYEQLAEVRIVGLVERYLAEYRSLLQDDPECRAALRTILDAFVEAGWPAAQRVSYRLDEIFR